MPLQKMPNGEFVDIADGTPPEVVAKIASNYAAPKPAPQSRTERRAAGQPRKPQGGYGGVDEAVNAMTFGLSDKIGNAVSAPIVAGMEAARGKGFHPIDAYNRLADNTEAARNQYQDENPLGSLAASVGGALANPVGTGATGLALAAEKLGGNALGRAAGKASEFIASRGAVGQGIAAGALQGGLQSAGESDSLADVPGNALRGAGIGAVAGGALGALGNGAARGVQIIRDRRPIAAQRRAYERVAGLLEKGGMTPEQARGNIASTDNLGGDAIVADLTPGLQAKAANIARNVDVPKSNDLIEFGRTRAQGKQERFNTAVSDRADMPQGVNSLDSNARGETITAARKAAGQRDYADGGNMDTPVQWSDNLDKFFKDSPDADRLIRRAYTTAQREGQDIGRIEESGQVVPSFRVFDYLKREFDTDIGMAMRAGDATTASGMSKALGRLKDQLAEANPQYADVLATQRDAFQKQRALETGQDVLKRMAGNRPREVMKEYNKLDESQQKEWRIGVLDAVLGVGSKANPTNFVKSLTRTPAQRQVLETAFGREMNFSDFERWIAREQRSNTTDEMLGGRQSITSTVAGANGSVGDDLGDVAFEGIRGLAYGGVTGGGAGVFRHLKALAAKDPIAVQDEIAKLLLSKGEGLSEGVNKAKDFASRRAARNQRRAVLLGKAGQQPFAGIANSGE